MKCKNCENEMMGDGFKSRYQCADYEGEDDAPDSPPAYCLEHELDWKVGQECLSVEHVGVCRIVLIDGSQVVLKKECGRLVVSFLENLELIK